MCPEVPSLFPRVPVCTSRGNYPGDTEPSSREVPAYPLCALPAMTPAHGTASRPPPPAPRRPKPPASAAHAGERESAGPGGSQRCSPALRGGGGRTRSATQRCGQARGAARTLRRDQRKKGRGWVLGTARERERSGWVLERGACGFRKNLVGPAGHSESSWVRTRGLRLPSSWP